ERLGGLLPPPGVRERLHQVGDGEQPGGRVGEARVAGQPQEGGRVGRAVGGEVEAGGRPRAERGGADEAAAAGGAGEPLQVAARGPLVAVEGGRERERGELLGGVRVQLGGAGEAQPVVAGRDGGRRVPEEGLAASGDHQRVRLQRRVPGPAGGGDGGGGEGAGGGLVAERERGERRPRLPRGVGDLRAEPHGAGEVLARLG